MVQIEEFRKNHERFHEDLNRQLLGFHSGRFDAIRIAGVYSDFSDLFSVDTIRELSTQIDQTPDSFPSRRKSLERMRAFAVELHLDASVCRLDQEIAAHTAGKSFVWDGDEIPYPRISSLLRSEPDVTRRRALQRIRTQVTSESEGLCVDRVLRLQAASEKLGYKSYVDALQSCTGVDYETLSATSEILIAATEARYSDTISESFGATLGLALEQADASDVGFWEHANEPRRFFRAALIEPVLRDTIAGLDITPENPDAIGYDLQPRPRKQAGFSCIPVRIPQEIHVIGVRDDGPGIFAALLHEAGHADHFAWTSASLPAELRLTGDRALCEAFGFLFEDFVLNESWLAENVGLLSPGAFLRFQGLLRSYLVRREIAKLRFALTLWKPDGLQDAPERFADMMNRVTGVHHDPRLWTQQACNGLAAADYIRGWTAAAMVQDYFSTRFGTSWHRNRSAGKLLKEIWETGQLYTADELCRELGLGDPDPQILADHLQQGLRR